VATSFPYASPGAIAKAIEKFSKSFPPVVNANTLKKFSIAPNNESYVISVLRFLGFVDEEGNRVDDNVSYFYGDSTALETGLEGALRQAYKPLFDDFGETTWEKSKDELVPWFRATDKSSDTVGARQASTFIALAGLAGHGVAPAPSNGATTTTSVSPSPTKAKPATKAKPTGPADKPSNNGHSGTDRVNADLGLSVRVEINLPANGDQDTYDAIFRSIRKNLIEGKQD
jgi:hypothetical protein